MGVIFLFFRRSTTTVASVIDLIRPSQVYHTERSTLFTTRWAWRGSSTAAEFFVYTVVRDLP